MREIKFRLWDLKNKYMFSNDNEELLLNIDGSNLWGHNIHYYDGTDLLEIDDFEIMQYTGLKDSNGVEIYEGDIVATKRTGLNGTHIYITEAIGEVMFGDCNFYILQTDDVIDPLENYSVGFENVLTEIITIGNVYENSNLLEE